MKEPENFEEKNVTIESNEFLKLLTIFLKTSISHDLNVHVQVDIKSCEVHHFPISDIFTISTYPFRKSEIEENIQKFITFINALEIKEGKLTIFPSGITINFGINSNKYGFSKNVVTLSLHDLNTILNDIAVYASKKESNSNIINCQMRFFFRDESWYDSTSISFSPYFTTNSFDIFSNTLTDIKKDKCSDKYKIIERCNLFMSIEKIERIHLKLIYLTDIIGIDIIFY